MIWSETIDDETSFRNIIGEVTSAGCSRVDYVKSYDSCGCFQGHTVIGLFVLKFALDGDQHGIGNHGAIGDDTHIRWHDSGAANVH